MPMTNRSQSLQSTTPNTFSVQKNSRLNIKLYDLGEKREIDSGDREVERGEREIKSGEGKEDRGEKERKRRASAIFSVLNEHQYKHKMSRLKKKSTKLSPSPPPPLL